MIEQLNTYGKKIWKEKLILFTFILCGCIHGTTEPTTKNYTPLATITSWQNNHISDQQIYQEGIVYKILQDDQQGSRHQKFILKLMNEQTLLISHNIDLATRIPNLQNKDTVIFFGEYEWNRKGGVVHWTHKDPRGKHANGFLIHKGKKYD